MVGTVESVVPDRGFSFVRGEDGRVYFLHRSGRNDINDFANLAVGQGVRFDAEESVKGPRASKVSLT